LRCIRFFVFELGARTGHRGQTEIQTVRRTGKTHNVACKTAAS